jgi:hypothetical protein
MSESGGDMLPSVATRGEEAKTVNPVQPGKHAIRQAIDVIASDFKAAGRVAKLVAAKLIGPEPPRVVTFLSGSLRAKDLPLLEAFRRYLDTRGFRCFTIGNNTSFAEPVEQAVRRLVDSSDCMIGIATARFDATDLHGAGATLRLTASWLAQEPAMAYQARVPHLIFRASDVTLQGVPEAHLHIVVNGLRPDGTLRFGASKEAVAASLADLRQKARARRAARSRQSAVNALKTLSAFAVGGYITIKAVEQLGRPPCFTTFDTYDPDCKLCPVKKDCRAEKIRRA